MAGGGLRVRGGLPRRDHRGHGQAELLARGHHLAGGTFGHDGLDRGPGVARVLDRASEPRGEQVEVGWAGEVDRHPAVGGSHHAPRPARRGGATGGKIHQLGPRGGEAGPVHRHPVTSEVAQQFGHRGGGPEPIGHSALGGRVHADGPGRGLVVRPVAGTGAGRDLSVVRDGGGRRGVPGDHDLGPQHAVQGTGPVGHGTGARLEEADVPQRCHDVHGGAPRAAATPWAVLRMIGGHGAPRRRHGGLRRREDAHRGLTAPDGALTAVPTPAVRRCSVDEALALLSAPDAAEECSVVQGCAALVVEGGAEEWPDDELTPRQRRTLEWLPCVTVAPAEGPAWRRFDVAAQPDGTEQLATPEDLLTAVADRPEAATALVRLVRAARRSDPDSALWAESVTYGLLQSGGEFAAWRSSAPAATPGPSGWVDVARTPPGTTVTLVRPERHNALDVSLRDALVDALRGLALDDRPITLRGAGPSFCRGVGLAAVGTFPHPVPAHLIRSTRLPARAVADVRHRLTTQVHGACVGAGVELAAFASHVVAAPGTTFRLPEVAMGLVPGSGGTWSVSRRIGAARANWLALTGAAVDDQLAVRWGLVDEVSDGILAG